MKNSCCKNNYKIVIAKILIVVSCFSNKVWTCQDSEYTKILNMTVLHKVWWHDWIIPEYTWICLIMSGYVWKCKNMLEYAWICLNPPELLWFYISSFSHLFCYFNRWLLIWTSTGDYKHSLKEQKTVFFKIQNLFFFHSSWKYLFVFYFRLDTFGGWGVNLDIPF